LINGNIENKKPSAELVKLIKEAAKIVIGFKAAFGPLWNQIKDKGQEEGFDEKDLQKMLKPYLTDELGLSNDRVYYLFHAEDIKKKQRARDKSRKIAAIAAKKPLDDSSILDDLDKEVPVSTIEAPILKTEAELAQDEYDAAKQKEQELHARETEKMKKLQALPAMALTEESIFSFLKERANMLNYYYYESYGLIHWRGQLESFKRLNITRLKRLYFEV